MQVINTPLSFIDFTGAFTDPVPVKEEGDLKFQVLLEFDDAAQATAFMASGAAFIDLMTPDFDPADTSTVGPTLLIHFADLTPAVNAAQIQISETRVLIYWDAGLPGFQGVVSPEGCAVLMLEVALPAAPHLFFRSNRIYRDGGGQPSSVLEYSCDEDAYGFHYCSGFYPNRMRLPLYLARPQYQDEESVYIKSNGERKVLKSVSRREFQGFVDMLPDSWHERIKMALSHDTVQIEGDTYQGGISKNGNYDIEWPEVFDYDGANAKFKALVTPYSMRNSNCATCLPWECVLVATITDIAAEGSLPEYPYTIYGTNYSITGGLADDLLFEFSEDSGATWQPVNLQPTPTGGGYQQYYDIGHPGVGSSVPHTLRITPLCDGGLPGTSGTSSI